MDINIFMTKKRVLIIGTSHSEGSCTTFEEPERGVQKLFQMGQLTWHDYFKKEYDYEVVNISKSAVTPQGMLWATYNYFLDHPDSKFDLVIIEGRGIENNVSVPVPRIGTYDNPTDSELMKQASNEYYDIDNIDSRKVWQHFVEDDKRTNKIWVYDLIHHMSADSEERIPKLMEWYVTYAKSALHLVDIWASNVALINLCEQHSENVRFFCWYSDEIHRDSYADMMGINLIPDKNHLFGDTKYKIFFDHFDDAHRDYPESYPIPEEFLEYEDWDAEYENKHQVYHCQCHHLNEWGHKRLWKQMIEPRLKKLNLL